ncbi:MAG: hypothetical protein GF364_21560 [Candidatus Lokiarchaeota archaeon]|nr:hypothetical protein [Candidatus Lokiarchaeota archaeon]
MKRLNKKGINKIITVLEGQYNSVSINKVGDLLVGELSDKDMQIMKDSNVVAENVGENHHSLFYEDAPIETEDETMDDQQEIVEPVDPISPNTEESERMSTTDIRNMLDQLVPELRKFFPTKEEINQALNDLAKQMIDPEEWKEILNKVGTKINKQSRPDDEIG